MSAIAHSVQQYLNRKRLFDQPSRAKMESIAKHGPKIQKLHNKGIKYVDIAKVVGLHPTTCRRYLNAYVKAKKDGWL